MTHFHFGLCFAIKATVGLTVCVLYSLQFGTPYDFEEQVNDRFFSNNGVNLTTPGICMAKVQGKESTSAGSNSGNHTLFLLLPSTTLGKAKFLKLDTFCSFKNRPFSVDLNFDGSEKMV